MVLLSQLRNAVKRIPMIKFRSGGKNQHTESAQGSASPVAAASSVSHWNVKGRDPVEYQADSSEKFDD